MGDEVASIVNVDWPRRLGGLRIEVHAVDDAGVVQSAWGVYIQGDLPVDPFALKRELDRIRDGSGGEVRRIERREAFSVGDFAHFIIETTPEALYAALLALGLEGIVQQLKGWVRTPKTGVLAAPRSSEEVLTNSIRRAQYLARDTYGLHFEPLPVISHSLSETAKLEDATAMVVLMTQDGSVISVHMWVADGATRHTITRSYPQTFQAQ